MLADSENIFAEIFRLNENNHLGLEDCDAASGVFEITAINESLLLPEIYEGVIFEV